jgi:hypothetical protein
MGCAGNSFALVILGSCFNLHVPCGEASYLCFALAVVFSEG